jgi:hypothetical protein
MSKTVSLKKTELRYHLCFAMIDAIGSILYKAIPWAGVVFIGCCGYLSVRVLSGQQTLADIVVKFFADFGVSQKVAYVVGAGGVACGSVYRRRRNNFIEKNAEQIKVRESSVDPRRSSSRLTRRGETRPEDKP